MMKYVRQALVVYAGYKSKMTRRVGQTLNAEMLRETRPRSKSDLNTYSHFSVVKI
nr:MAG TPA: hypothetical protein [Caudoviricetes sp.]